MVFKQHTKVNYGIQHLKILKIYPQEVPALFFQPHLPPLSIDTLIVHSLGLERFQGISLLVLLKGGKNVKCRMSWLEIRFNILLKLSPHIPL